MKLILQSIKALLRKYAKPADWNQNDPAAPDYVKNRPFYEKTTVCECVFSETDFEQDGDLYYSERELEAGYSFAEGSPVSISFNDNKYTLPLQAGEGFFYVDAEEQYGFYIDFYVYSEFVVPSVSLAVEPVGDVVITFTKVYTKKLDTKFMPSVVKRHDPVQDTVEVVPVLKISTDRETRNGVYVERDGELHASATKMMSFYRENFEDAMTGDYTDSAFSDFLDGNQNCFLFRLYHKDGSVDVVMSTWIIGSGCGTPFIYNNALYAVYLDWNNGSVKWTIRKM